MKKMITKSLRRDALLSLKKQVWVCCGLFLMLLVSSASFGQGESCAVAVEAVEGLNSTPDFGGNGGAAGALTCTGEWGDAAATDAYWFSYIAPGDGSITISACETTDADTRVNVLTGACDALSCVAGNDDGDACPNFESELFLEVVEGTEYLIVWDDRWGSGESAFDWTLSFDEPIEPCESPELGLQAFEIGGVEPIDGCLDGGTPWIVSLGVLGGSGNASYDIFVDGEDSGQDVLAGGSAIVGGFFAGEEVEISIVGSDNSDCSASGLIGTELCPTGPGCTDPIACNYDPAASEDDGSCELPQWYIPEGGTGPAAQFACEQPEGYILADQDCAQEVIDADSWCITNSWDGLCNGAYLECTAVPGCIDDAACNFNPEATEDDGSCFFDGDDCELAEGGPGFYEDCECVPVAVIIPGCTDESACNFNPEANDDDGSCVAPEWYIPVGETAGPALLACELPEGYELADQDCAEQTVGIDPFCVNNTWDGICQGEYDDCLGIVPVPGCTNQEACNFNPEATEDDGSCLIVGDACDDGDPDTENDVIGDDCVCAGTPIPTGPENDLICDAAPAACGDVIEGSTVGASLDEVGFCGTSNTAPGVWYNAFVEGGTILTLSTCNNADYDTKISVFAAADCEDELVCVGGNDDGPGCSGFTSQLTVDIDEDQNLFILVHGFSSATGDFTLTLSCEDAPEPPANDDCEAAAPIACGDVVEGSTANANADDAGTCGTSNTAPGVWYSFTADANSDVLASLCGSSYDTKLSVFTGSCEELVCIDGNDDACGLQSEVAFSAEAGVEYLILVHGFGSATGDFQLSMSCIETCANYEYYLADILVDGTTNIYEVDLDGSDANLSLVATSDIEVHIALNEEDGLIYAVSKLDGSFRTLDPATGVFGPVEMLDLEVSEIVGAAFNADGKLLILSQSENAIYSVMLGSNATSVFDSYSPALGGDIDFGADGALYLATREGFGTFYVAIPDEVADDILVGDAPQLVTGVADTESQNLIFSHRDAMTLEVREYDGTPGEPFNIKLGGEPFMTFNGDLASGCADNRQPVEPCEQVIYYTNQPPGGGSYTLYATTLNGDGTATNVPLLEDLGSAHIGVTPDGSTIYIVGGSNLDIYDVDAGVISGTVNIVNEAGASLSGFPACLVAADGTLYIGGNGDNVYTLDPVSGVASLFTSAYDVNGGDLIEAPTGPDGAGELWLITRNDGEFTRLSDGFAFASGVPEINGAAVLANGNVLVANGDGDGDDALIEIDLSDLSVAAAYDVDFNVNNGDLAAACVSGSDNEAIPGCTDEAACNYNPDATEDDGSCQGQQWFIPGENASGPAVFGCEAPEGYILADQECAQSTIDADGFCVNTSWDGICQGDYDACLGEEPPVVAENDNTLSSYPNPTNGPSVAVFTTVRTERATLEVYDMNGRLVQELFNGVTDSGVEYRIDFDGISLPNGVYMYRLTTGSATTIEKFTIAR